MYFPYLRGRQYELLALKELVEGNLLSNNIVPVIEPTKITSTLVNTMDAFISKGHLFAVIMNPEVGSFADEWDQLHGEDRVRNNKLRFEELLSSPHIIKSLIMNSDIQPVLTYLRSKDIAKSDLLLILKDRDSITLFEDEFQDAYPQYILIPDEGAYRRKITSNRVMLADKFERQNRNADYLNEPDEFFTDDHLYYSDDGYIGFSDYSVVGTHYQEAGFSPHAIAIHIVYCADDQSMRIKHFVSDSNDSIENPAKKFYEAVSKLHDWYVHSNEDEIKTTGLVLFLQHFINQTYPGLGIVKKLSIMHHLELVSRHMREG